MGDLSELGNDKDAMKAKVTKTYTDGKPGAVPGTAGTLLSFAYRMQVGDFVIYPHRPDSTLKLRAHRQRLHVRPFAAPPPQSPQGHLAQDRCATHDILRASPL
jgi:hypothetical protein